MNQTEKIQKSQAIPRNQADAETDIGLINKYATAELKPEDVFVMSLALCDTDIDRDYERFTEKAIEKLAELFDGKPGIFDHSGSARDQVARIYKTYVEKEHGQAALRACAYMLRTNETEDIIRKIEGGIIKEVSISGAVKKRTCSLCKSDIAWGACSNGHTLGEKYDGIVCYAELDDPIDAYEFSFVAIPAQRGAAVTKNLADVKKAIEILLTADLSKYEDAMAELSARLKSALKANEDRQKVIKANAVYLNDEWKTKGTKS